MLEGFFSGLKHTLEGKLVQTYSCCLTRMRKGWVESGLGLQQAEGAKPARIKCSAGQVVCNSGDNRVCQEPLG